MSILKKEAELKNEVEAVDGDYIYTYHENLSNREPGWSVRLNVRADKETYGPILSEIQGKPVIDIAGLFHNCKNMTHSPLLPETLKYMNKTYADCASLEKPPLIPDGVIEMQHTFDGCASLKQAPDIPQSVQDLTGAFAGCSALECQPMVANQPAFASNWQKTINCFAGCGFMQNNGDLVVPELVRIEAGTYAGKLKMGEMELCFHYQRSASENHYSTDMMLITMDMLSVINGQKPLNKQMVKDMLMAYARYDEIYQLAYVLTEKIEIEEYKKKLDSWRARIPQGYTCVSVLSEGKALLLENAAGEMMVLM